MSQRQSSRSEIEINEDKLYQEESCVRDRWSTVGLVDASILTDKGMEKETCGIGKSRKDQGRRGCLPWLE